MNKGGKTLAVGYVRVSTEIQQKDGFSLEAQQDDIMRYCRYKDYEFVRFYKDEAKSGKNMEREYLLLMLEELKHGMIVITKSLSRLSRSVKDANTILEQIKEKGCNLVILDIEIDTTNATGKLMFNVISSVSQFERENTSEKVSNTLTHMSREGKLVCKPRYGYMICNDGEKKNHIIENPEEQLVIQRIKQLIDDDPKINISSIVRVLISEGITMRKSATIYPHYVSKIIKDNNLRS